MKFDEIFILPFVKEHLAYQATVELKKAWQEGAESIPEHTSY